ncbi:DUF475 domain-containing protein [Psychromonas sp. SP041]|uniref:DUF475 domain-containing protein n=1 Tax=Psychromonas sp. SP041 TaxID=1365007 RepID=UPI0010C797D7|nr:DUF475 domain-containing protein [Psychromonas sp. SP041]
MENLKFFKFSFLLTALGLGLAMFIGGPKALFIVSVLTIMEISLSFDNAVVNAAILKDMDPKWQKRFLTWGILIAVFGMRIVFPLLVVCVAGGISPLEALDIAINDHAQYAAYMHQEHISLMGFGSGFLLLVGLNYFIDEEKETNWFNGIESTLTKIGKIPLGPVIVTGIMLAGISVYGLGFGGETTEFAIAAQLGVLSHEVIGFIAKTMEGNEEKRSEAAAKGAQAVAKNGLAMFMYLEVLDASFSFDGVIGAFAITTDIFIIAIGLGVGAMFVRSLTILLVEKGTLSEYKYLEHGAFYAIIALAIIMAVKSFYDVPEVVTGLIGVSFIVFAIIASIVEARKETKAEDKLASEATNNSTVNTHRTGNANRTASIKGNTAHRNADHNAEFEHTDNTANKYKPDNHSNSFHDSNRNNAVHDDSSNNCSESISNTSLNTSSVLNDSCSVSDSSE